MLSGNNPTTNIAASYLPTIVKSGSATTVTLEFTTILAGTSQHVTNGSHICRRPLNTFKAELLIWAAVLDV